MILAKRVFSPHKFALTENCSLLRTRIKYSQHTRQTDLILDVTDFDILNEELEFRYLFLAVCPNNDPSMLYYGACGDFRDAMIVYNGIHSQYPARYVTSIDDSALYVPQGWYTLFAEDAVRLGSFEPMFKVIICPGNCIMHTSIDFADAILPKGWRIERTRTRFVLIEDK